MVRVCSAREVLQLALAAVCGIEGAVRGGTLPRCSPLRTSGAPTWTPPAESTVAARAHVVMFGEGDSVKFGDGLKLQRGVVGGVAFGEPWKTTSWSRLQGDGAESADFGVGVKAEAVQVRSEKGDKIASEHSPK